MKLYLVYLLRLKISFVVPITQNFKRNSLISDYLNFVGVI